jgi:hypothetical protein
MPTHHARDGWFVHGTPAVPATSCTAGSAEKPDQRGNTLLTDDPVREAARPIVERRRPNRVAYQSAELIRLLRVPASIKGGSEALPADNGWEAAAEADDPLRAARGLAMGVLLSGGLWVVLGAALWCLLL